MNLPNKITISRIILVPLIMVFYMISAIPYGKLIATILFLVASITDFLDGYLARKNNQVTDTGKFLDPIADKLLVMAGILVIIMDNILPLFVYIIICALIFARDYLVNSLRQVASAKGVVIAADKSGKIKTILLDISLVGMMLLGAIQQEQWFGGLAFDIISYIIYAVGAMAMFMLVYSTVVYFYKNRNVLKGEWWMFLYLLWWMKKILLP